MEYKLKINGDIYTVESNKIDDKHLKISFNGIEHEARFERIDDNRIYLNIMGRGINAYIVRNRDSKSVVIDGVAYLIEDAEKTDKKRPKERISRDVPQTVTPPMPAVIVRIMVKEGDRVKKDQGVVVVSAMKLETTLTAPFNGTVIRVNAGEGDKVMPGQILVDIEKDNEGGANNE